MILTYTDSSHTHIPMTTSCSIETNDKQYTEFNSLTEGGTVLGINRRPPLTVVTEKIITQSKHT